MARKVLECLCPCFFEIKEDPLQIELPLLRNVSKLEFPEREFSPDLCSSRERYVLPEFKLHEEAKRRSTASCKMEEHQQHKQIEVTPICLSASTRNRVLQQKEQSNSKEDDKSFKSFKDDHSLHKSSSIMKRSIKLLRFQSNKSSRSEMFHSVAGDLQIVVCTDPSFGDIMAKLYGWVEELEAEPLLLKQADIIDLQRIRKIALLEIHTKVEEFDNFSEDHNLIYKNSELQMQVELKDFPKIFEERIYATLCRFTVDCSILTFFSLFNSSECQSRLNSLTDYKVAAKQPFLILQTEQLSNQLAGRRNLQLLKFSELVAEEIYGIERKYVYEIDRDLRAAWLNSKEIFKRITRVSRDNGPLQIEIYTEMTMNFKPGVDEKSYFSHCHNKFAEFLLRKLRRQPK